jgi:hypothetical protein
LALLAVAAVGLVVVSGGSEADPRTPAGLPGLPPPFLGTTVLGDGGLTAGVDAYGDVVDLRAPGPAGRALIDNPSDRQAAGTVPADTGIVPRVSVDGGPVLPLWRAGSVSQRYLPGTNVTRTVGRFGRVRVVVEAAARGRELAVIVQADAPAGTLAVPSVAANVADEASCVQRSRGGSLVLLCGSESVATEVDFPGRLVAGAAAADRAWLSTSVPLGPEAPGWARRLYARSLLTLRALTDRRSGAVAAGARDGWAYVWPRDAATACLALEAAGYRDEAREVARYLSRIDLSAAARFDAGGDPVPGRGPQGDAAGWVAVAARATDFPLAPLAFPWRGRPDYQEGAAGDYLANAIASAASARGFEMPDGLGRRAGDPSSGLDSAAAWAVRPFSMPSLYPDVRRTLLRLTAAQTRFGLGPGEGWTGGTDPWTAPTAWTAWSLAALADAAPDPHAARDDRRRALRLLGDLRRAATPAGALPERVDARSGLPRSTTPLAWSHAFSILALRQLWPSR